nr:reverse transcriptase domain-containing protein [Tanacetum cinerariifolium]
MDDEPMWAPNHVVSLTPSSAITIPEIANEFAIKGNYLTLVKGNQFDGSSNFDTDKITARMDAMTLKMDAQYKELQSNAKPDLDDDDIPMSREEEAKFMKTFQTPINFNSDDEDDEPTQQPKTQNLKPAKKTPLPKPYKPKPPYPQRLRKEKMEAPCETFLDMIRAIRINVHLVDVLARMPNYGKFLKEIISNKHKIEQISAAFLSDESSAMIQNNVPPKLGDPGSFLIPCNFNRTFSCNALVDLCASINLMLYSLYAKLSLETLKPTKISVRLADRSFQYPIGIAENMLVKVGKFTFLADFVILEMEEDSKVPLILGRPFLHTADVVIHVNQNNSTLDIDVIDEILKKDFDALLNEGSKILHSIEGTLLNEEIFAEFDEFMAMIADENSDSESDIEEQPFEKITMNTNPCVSPIHCVPKKGGITGVTNENDELVPTRTITGWREKRHFMVKEEIVLGHKVSSAGLEVDKAKVDVISKLPPPTNIKRIRSEVNDNFPGETLMEINTKDEPCFADFTNYVVGDVIPKGMTYQQKNKFFSALKHYFWEAPYLFKPATAAAAVRKAAAVAAVVVAVAPPRLEKPPQLLLWWLRWREQWGGWCSSGVAVVLVVMVAAWLMLVVSADGSGGEEAAALVVLQVAVAAG